MIDLPPYPGRGAAVHRHHDGGVEWIYFLTGRSETSRRRVLHAEDGRLLVVAADEGTAPDPLRHYACVRTVGQVLVVGNGDHVDQIADAIARGEAPDDAIERFEPEPDPPIHTPRIAVVAPGRADAGPVTVLSVRRLDDGVERLVVPITLEPGEVVLVHTYGGDANQVTSDARPHRFDGGPAGTDVAGRLWHALDPDLRVALAVGRAPSPIPERVLAERQR